MPSERLGRFARWLSRPPRPHGATIFDLRKDPASGHYMRSCQSATCPVGADSSKKQRTADLDRILRKAFYDLQSGPDAQAVAASLKSLPNAAVSGGRR